MSAVVWSSSVFTCCYEPELPMLPHPQKTMLAGWHEIPTVLNYTDRLHLNYLHDFVPFSLFITFKSESTARHMQRKEIIHKW